VTRWKIDWHGNIVPEKEHVPSISPIFATPRDAQAYIRESEKSIRVYRGQ
jgi:hypothetical protein